LPARACASAAAISICNIARNLALLLANDKRVTLFACAHLIKHRSGAAARARIALPLPPRISIAPRSALGIVSVMAAPSRVNKA